MKNLDCPVLTEHWLTAWTKICSATFLSWTLKWRKYFPEICLPEGILYNGLSNTLSTEYYAWLFLSKTHRKNTSVKVCTMPGGFQLIPVCSRRQPLFTDDEVSSWYLLVSLLSFPNILEVESIWKWGSDKTCSPLLVHTVNGFLCKKKTSIFELLVITVPVSSILTSAHLLLKDKWFAQGLRASGKTSGWVLW